MPQRLPFRKVKDAVVAADGTATIRFQITDQHEWWEIQMVAAMCSTNTLEPEFNTNIDGVFTGGSYSGSKTNDTTFNQQLHTQETLYGVWTGADVGATVTMSVSGWKNLP